VQLANDYTNNGALKVAGGTLDLTSKGTNWKKGSKLTLATAAGVADLDGSTVLVTDGSSIVANDIANKTFNVVLDSSASGDDEGKLLIMSKADGTNIGKITAGKDTIAADQNLFAIDTQQYTDAAGANVAAGAAFAKGYAVRTVDADKLKGFVAAQNFTGDLKELSDSIANAKIEKDLRKFVILAGSDKDRGGANLASAMPRNLAETQKNLLRAQSLVGVTRSADAIGASDDLKSSAALWAKANFGKGSQQVSDLASSSYDSSVFGGTVGAEFNLGDNARIGAAGSYSKTTLEYKGLRDGDKDEFKSMFGSLYGFATFNNNMVLNATVTVGNSDVEGTTVGTDGKASGSDEKISALSYGATILGGYKIDASSFSVTPLAGLAFSDYTDPARKVAYGLGSVKKSDITRVDLVGGLSIAGNMTVSDMMIVPELHGFIYYNVKGEKQQKTVDFSGSQGISYLATDTTKTNFTLGGSLTAKSGMVEYGASVDGQFADKYWGVLGSLKLKVNL